MITFHNFSDSLPYLAMSYAMSCLGAFLGLRCMTRARAHTGFSRARWLILAAVAIGAAGIWTMHFIAMIGVTIPGQAILYNVPLTIESMLIAIGVVGVGLFIIGYGKVSRARLVTAGVITGVGVAAMHYMGEAAMSMPDSVRYNIVLVILSLIIAIIAGTAALWAGIQVRGVFWTVGASLIMGVAVTGMHYTAMASMELTPDPMMAVRGLTAGSFLLPLIIGISLVTFILAWTISLSPTEDEVYADAQRSQRIEQRSRLMEEAARQADQPRPDPFPPAVPAPADPADPVAPPQAKASRRRAARLQPTGRHSAKEPAPAPPGPPPPLPQRTPRG